MHIYTYMCTYHPPSLHMYIYIYLTGTNLPAIISRPSGHEEPERVEGGQHFGTSEGSCVLAIW